MATFKQVPQSFLVNALLNYWGNMVKNYQGSVSDNDFFEIVQNGYHHDRAVELIEATLTPSELKNLTEIRSRRSRLDLDDSLQDIFQVLWNNEKFRQKSRDMLLFIKDSLLEEIEKAKSDTLKLRFRELKRIFKLNELEYEVLLFAFLSKGCTD